jgi:hypothetical protein
MPAAKPGLDQGQCSQIMLCMEYTIHTAVVSLQ